MKKVVDLTQNICYNIYVRLRNEVKMMENKQYFIYRGYRGTDAVAIYYSYDQVMAYIMNYAAGHNNGIYRSWCIDDIDFYDCGPTVFKVIAKDFEDIREVLLT